MSKVAVLGCGPAGLLVAHAVVRYGWTPDIISVKQKSEIPGSQHLQGHIPGITPMYPDSAVEFIRIGTAEGYAQKVYGSPTHPTGWPNYTGIYKSWSVFKAYDKLWNAYRSLVRDSLVSVPVLPDILNEYHLVLSTLPMPTLCFKEHNFESTPFWIKTLPTPEIDADREVVVYNGLPKDEWYRWSILGGKSSYEGSFTFPPEGSYVGKKAIGNNCDCWPGLHRLGRWAQWKHGVLLHHAHSEALDVVLHTIGRKKVGVTIG